MDIGSMIAAYKAHGWNDEAAIVGDINAGGWRNKEWLTGGGSAGGQGAFNFDMTAATNKALSELAPYYQKLLDMYGGDVALAKQRLDQDYERGLRVKTEDTEWTKTGYDQQMAERQRQFQIAMRDLNEDMNRRGIYTSGLTERARQEATAAEQYQQGQIERSKEQLARELAQYKEQSDVEYRRALEEKGYIKPTTTTTAGTYAPSQVGVTTPSVAPSATQMGYSTNLSQYVSEPSKKLAELEKQKRDEAAAQAEAAYNRAYSTWSAQAQQLAKTY